MFVLTSFIVSLTNVFHKTLQVLSVRRGSVALYSAYRTYVPYSLFAFPDLEPRYRHRRHVISCITSLSLFPCVARLAFVAC